MNHAESMWAKVQAFFVDYPSWVPEVVVAVFCGIIIGFVARLLGKYFLVGMLLMIVLGVALHEAGYISITLHKEAIEQLIGVSQVPSMTVVKPMIWNHVATVAAGVLSFILGWRLGR